MEMGRLVIRLLYRIGLEDVVCNTPFQRLLVFPKGSLFLRQQRICQGIAVKCQTQGHRRVSYSFQHQHLNTEWLSYQVRLRHFSPDKKREEY